MTTTIIFIYLGIVLCIGLLSNRLFRGTGEDYFVASRSIGPFLLLMSLFGTNMTAFAILGASGEAYHRGIGVFALMPSASALIIPTVFFFIGTRVWALGKKHDFLTQVQYFRQRWDSDGFGLLLFVVMIALLIPYLLIGVMGGGITLAEITKGQIPQWAGGLLVCLVVLTYVSFGGMRGTAWANAFQTMVFMILGGVAFFVIIDKLGGLDNAIAQVSAKHPDLLIRGEHISPLKMLSYTCIPLSVGMFPHLFTHWLTAKSARTFRWPLIFYPLCIAIVWLPSVLLGLFGHLDFPGLKGPMANSVLVKMIDMHAPGVLAGLLAAGVFAAIMSSLDSQVLSISNMFTQDIVRHYRKDSPLSEKSQVLWGRIFVFFIFAITYGLSLISARSIFTLAVWSFTGFASLFPIIVAALFWRRSTKTGAFASVITVAVLWCYFFFQGWKIPGYTVGMSGAMPVALILAASAVAIVVGSLLSKPPQESTLEKFF